MPREVAKCRVPKVVAEALSAKCSKETSHRILPEKQQFEIPHKFPRFPQIMGDWIVRRIKKKETGEESMHPCTRTFDTFLDCCRRHPNTYLSKCRTSGGASFPRHAWGGAASRWRAALHTRRLVVSM